MKHAADTFLGKAGTQVPVVDPEDLKTVWRIYEETNARHLSLMKQPAGRVRTLRLSAIGQ